MDGTQRATAHSIDIENGNMLSSLLTNLRCEPNCALATTVLSKELSLAPQLFPLIGNEKDNYNDPSIPLG